MVDLHHIATPTIGTRLWPSPVCSWQARLRRKPSAPTPPREKFSSKPNKNTKSSADGTQQRSFTYTIGS